MAEPVWIKSSVGGVDTAGAFSESLAAVTIGSLIIFQCNQDADSGLAGLDSLGTCTGIESLAGVADTMTLIADAIAIGTGPTSSHTIYIGRATAVTITVNATTPGTDVHSALHEFTDESGGATTLAGVIENGSAGAYVNRVGTVSPLSAAQVDTLDVDRLVVQLGAVSDDAQASFASFIGMSGGTYVMRHQFGSSAGTDAAICLHTLSKPTAGQVLGGTDVITPSVPWGCVGFALISSGGAPPPEPDDKFFPFI